MHYKKLYVETHHPTKEQMVEVAKPAFGIIREAKGLLLDAVETAHVEEVVHNDVDSDSVSNMHR